MPAFSYTNDLNLTASNIQHFHPIRFPFYSPVNNIYQQKELPST